MYEAPEYWELKKTITHWETVRRYIDLARTFRSMSYHDELKLESRGRFGASEGHELTLSDSLKTDVLSFLADRCEDVAAKIAATPPEGFDVRRACKV